MDPLTFIAVGSSILKGVSSIFGGLEKRRQAKAQAREIENQAHDVDLQSLQASERRVEELRMAMANLTALRSARNIGLDSPTAMAMENEVQRMAVRDQLVERLGYTRQAASMRRQGAATRAQGRFAVVEGALNSVGSFVDAFTTAKGPK